MYAGEKLGNLERPNRHIAVKKFWPYRAPPNFFRTYSASVRHAGRQKAALAGIYQEVGFARSLLAYELPDGRLKLIDGHLRRDIDPDMEVDVEVLDVNDEEARKLLLTIDPLASLAEQQEELRKRLLEITPVKSPELQSALQATVDNLLNVPHDGPGPGFQTIKEQFLILVTCRDEKEQVELLRRFRDEGWECKALVAFRPAS